MGQLYELRFPVKEQDIVGLRDRVSRQLHDAGVGGDTAYALVNVVDEICCNMMEYSEASWMKLEVDASDSKIHTLLQDNGVEFDPITAIQNTDPNQPATVTERRLGLYMVGIMARDLLYRREDGINCFSFTMKRN